MSFKDMFGRRIQTPEAAPRGYCAECGAALIDMGTQEVPNWTAGNVGARFDRATGKPIGTKLWRQWECPNKVYIPNRGWIHSSHTDYDVKQ